MAFSALLMTIDFFDLLGGLDDFSFTVSPNSKNHNWSLTHNLSYF